MCKSCGVKSNYLPSTRIHGRHPTFQFRICKHCGMEVQVSINADGSFHEFSTSVYKGGSNKLSLRVSDAKFDEYMLTGKTVRDIFELGLETYKNLQKSLEGSL